MMDRRAFLSVVGVAGLDIALPKQLSALATEERSPTNAPSLRRSITFNQRCFQIDGRNAFLVAGDIHYFRVAKAAWRQRMELFKEAGGNCIVTYIPWALHEPQEGQFLFQSADGICNFESFLEAAGESGLLVNVRPGPFIGSEIKRGGLPDWLIEGYPQLLARRFDNKTLGDTISYMHPAYVERVRRWYAHVCPIIARHTVDKGGPVALMQLDNEMTGAHLWRGSVDYNQETMGFGVRNGRYPEFLRLRYGTLAQLNDAYATHFNSFEAVTPLPPEQGNNFVEVRRARDYFELYLSTIAEFAKTLAGFAHESGVYLPFTCNAGEPAMSALFLETIHEQGKDFLMGADSYFNIGQDWLNNPTPQTSVNIFCGMEMLRLMGYPPNTFEIQAGSPLNWPPIQAGDCAAWYRMHLAYGMKGSNYYVFTGGPNPPELGMNSDDYDFGAAIGSDGEKRQLYEEQKEFGRFLKQNEWLIEADREADCRVALDYEAVRSARFWKFKDASIFSSPAAWDFMRKGVLTSSFCAGYSPELCDLSSDVWESNTELPLIVPASISMSTAKQERIIRFLKNKGCVLIAPILPTLDENLRPSTRLADYLGSPEICNKQLEAVRINVDGIKNIAVTEGVVFTTTKLPVGAEVLGVDEWSGGVMAWQLETEGGGKVVFLGMSWSHARREHQQMLSSLMQRLGIRPLVSSTNPSVWTSLRTSGNRSGLFLMNLFTQPTETEVTVRHAKRSSKVELGRIRLEAMSVRYLEI